ncbi:MAG: sigma-70 family RNA polymerase sigma factor [Minicystis sp.]
MNDHVLLAERWEAQRPQLRGVAYRMLGSLSEADDAVQEAWLRLDRADTRDVENLGGWLTTVVARVCLDMLRSRKARREDAFDTPAPEPAEARAGAADPEAEMELARSVGLALLVILDLLDPAERVAFVLHDLFDMPFDEIAPIVGRSVEATRQLASRARRRVQGAPTASAADLAQQREAVGAFLAASRAGDLAGLLAVLDPDIVLRSDATALRADKPAELRGAALIAKRALAGGARAAQPALVNGSVGVVIAPQGRLYMVLLFTVAGGKIVAMEAVADRERLRAMDLAVLSG